MDAIRELETLEASLMIQQQQHQSQQSTSKQPKQQQQLLLQSCSRKSMSPPPRFVSHLGGADATNINHEAKQTKKVRIYKYLKIHKIN